MGEAAHEAEIAYLDWVKESFTLAFAVDEDIRGFEVAMDELGGVEVLEGPEHLVEDVSEMHVLQDGLSKWGGTYPTREWRSASM